jgi:hypothetical protein
MEAAAFHYGLRKQRGGRIAVGYLRLVSGLGRAGGDPRRTAYGGKLAGGRKPGIWHPAPRPGGLVHGALCSRQHHKHLLPPFTDAEVPPMDRRVLPGIPLDKLDDGLAPKTLSRANRPG